MTRDSSAGVLGRQHEMRRLKEEIRELQARHESAQRLARDGRTRLAQLEERREKLQKDASALLDEYSEAKASLDTARYQLEQANARNEAITAEADEIEKERMTAEEQVRSSRAQFSQASDALTVNWIRSVNLLETAACRNFATELDRVRDAGRPGQDCRARPRNSVRDAPVEQRLCRAKSRTYADPATAFQEPGNGRSGEQLEQSEEPLDRRQTRSSSSELLEVRLEVEDELAEARRKRVERRRGRASRAGPASASHADQKVEESARDSR